MATTAPTGGPIVVGADGSATSLTAVAVSYTHLTLPTKA